MTIVVKMGGHALDDLGASSPVLNDLAEDIAGLRSRGERVVLVHGGGPQIAELLARLGRESRFVEGLRVTDPETMRVVAMALGEVNVSVVAALNQCGVPGVGLNGADGALLRSTSLGEPWDRAGAAPSVDTQLIEVLLDGGFVPVVSSVSLDGDGGLLNCNADAAAGALAHSLNASQLVLLSDVDQIRLDPEDPKSARSHLSTQTLREMLESGAARDGMRPKVMAALAALDQGAASVLLASGTRSHALRRSLDGEVPTTEVHE